MQDVKNGDELLVFNADDEDEDDGDILIVRKWYIIQYVKFVSNV